MIIILLIGLLLLGTAVALVTRGVIAARLRTADNLGQIGRYAAISTIAAAGTTYLYNIDVVLSKHYLVASDAGIYAAASVLGRVAYFLGVTVTGVMFPEVATLHARDEPHFHVVDLSLALLAGVSVALMAFYAFLPGVVLLPFGSAFTPVAHYLWPFALALGMLAVANLLTNYFLSIGSARFAGALVAALGALYLAERFRTRVPAIESDQVPC